MKEIWGEFRFSKLPVDGIPVGSADRHELPRDGDGCSEQVLPLLDPGVQEALLTEGGVHITRNLEHAPR